MDNYTGKRLDGRYEIQEVIGVGGMAVVYKAYDNIDDRIVAVKILKDEYLANEEFRRRFKNESKAIAVLSHPNIVRVFNVSYGDRLQYIVMEHVEGITLKEYIEQQGRLGIKETVHFTMQILRALQHAHDKGIVHRDIKPQNILLLSNGNIKVTDFGIARFSYSDTKTMTDSAIGSVHYISPEQARGDTTDDRADIYSVGVVMYEMLTGQLPFQSDNSVSVALMQLQSDPKNPREINGNIPVGLEQIVMHAMRKNAKDRYQSAAEMLLDIEEFKRNPTIRFQKEYFVDNDPTKFVGRRVPPVAKPPVVAPPVVTPPAQPNPPITDLNIEDEEEDDYATPSKVGPVIIGLLIALIVLTLGVFGFLFITDSPILEKIPFLNGFTTSSTARVDNFYQKNYDTDVLNNEAVNEKYNIEIVEENNSRYADGVIIMQNPAANEKVEVAANGKVDIILTVARTNQKTKIPDVSGKTYAEAERILESKGFKVRTEPELSFLSYGTVIRTNPAADAEAALNTEVIIYYASDKNLVEVPECVGWDLETAKALVESRGLKVAAEIKEENSDKPAGTVISQTPAAVTKVLPSSEVVLVVSNGIPAESEITLNIILPSNGARGSFEIYLNNEQYQEKTLLFDGNPYEVTIIGSGEDASIKIYTSGKEYYTCTVDFTQSPAKLIDGRYSSSSSATTAKMPDVNGMTQEAAIQRLVTEGFMREYITVETIITTDISKDGRVMNQTPAPSSGSVILTTYYPVTEKITLYVGQMEGV